MMMMVTTMTMITMALTTVIMCTFALSFECIESFKTGLKQCWHNFHDKVLFLSYANSQQMKALDTKKHQYSTNEDDSKFKTNHD